MLTSDEHPPVQMARGAMPTLMPMLTSDEHAPAHANAHAHVRNAGRTGGEMRAPGTIVTTMLVLDRATAARRRFGADLTVPTEGRPATQVAAGSLENPKDRIF